MPQRTNDFQRIATAVHRYYAPTGAVVTPSAMVMDGAGVEREIDILVTFQVGLYPFRIAIEARDHARNLDVTEIERYIGKYNSNGGIVVNEVVIVANGFTSSARRKAALLGFQLQTIEQLENKPRSFFEDTWDLQPSPFTSENGSGTDQRKEKVLSYLFDIKGAPVKKALRDNGVLIYDGTRRGTFRKMVQALRPGFCQRVDAARKEMAGCMIQGVMNVNLSGYLIKKDSQVSKLGKIVLRSSNSSMVIPRMPATEHKVVNDSTGEHVIVVESTQNEHGNFEISYERGEDGNPKQLYVHITHDGGKVGAKKLILTWNV